MILIITNTQDITADFVVRELHKRKLKFARLNTDEFPVNGFGSYKINYNEGKTKYIYWKNRENILDFSDVKSVWYRRPILPVVGLKSQRKSIKKFCEDESYEFLRGVWYSLNAFWISDPEAIRKAEHKIFQLKVAEELSFTLPKTLFSNNSEEIQNFYSHCNDQVIIKPLYMGFVDDAKSPMWIYTSSLTKKEVQNTKSLNIIPSIYQEKIEKNFDVRVTVIGDKVFAAKIVAQNLPKNIPDWRYSPIKNLKHFKYKLPTEIEELCIRLVKKLGLEFGAIDFAVDKNNQHVFFEINPNGQWAWLENILKLPISSEIVNQLTR